MSLINKAHVSAATSIPTVKWNNNRFMFSRLIDHGFCDVGLLEAVAIDVWQAQHGWEWWEDKVRYTDTASVSLSCPQQPTGQSKAKPFYTIPVYSSEIGGRRDLIIKGKSCTDALSAFFTEIEDVMKEAQENNIFIIPVVKFTSKETIDFGVAPVFNIKNWMARPVGFSPVIVKL